MATSIVKCSPKPAQLQEPEEGLNTVLQHGAPQAVSDKAIVYLTNAEAPSDEQAGVSIPRRWKFVAISLICSISFGSAWSARLTASMKSVIKKELRINNTQFALLEASEEFMSTALMMVSGLVTDRIGGAAAVLYGNIIMTAGSIVIAGAATGKSYQLMIFGRIVTSLGDIATQIAAYRAFSAWFAPSAGFATTLGLEIGIGRIGGFLGSSTANIIASNTGNFAWTYWVSVFVCVFTNICTLVFWWFTKRSRERFAQSSDSATGEKLTEKTRRFELSKVLELPWAFWTIMLFSMMQTSCSNVYSQNATELAEQRFNIDAVKAGWYASLSQYAGFFFTPIIGGFIDMYGNRLNVMAVCGIGMLLSMALINWSTTTGGVAASYATFAFFKQIGPVVIIDGIRTSMWHQSVFGSAYAAKVTMNNATNILVRIIAGVVQDADDNSYRRVTIIYVFLAIACTVISLVLIVWSWFAADLQLLQYTRKERKLKGSFIMDRKRRAMNATYHRNRSVGIACLVALLVYVLGSWAAYFWGLSTGNN